MESWLTAVQPAVVALVQLAVVTAALHVARLAAKRAALAEKELDRFLKSSSSTRPRPSSVDPRGPARLKNPRRSRNSEPRD
jgi:hypothetical protein